MKRVNQISISALKRQPRHGMPDDKNRDPMDKRYISERTAQLTQLRKDISDLTGDINELAGTIGTKFTAMAKSVANESLAMQMGIGKLAAVFNDTADAATKLITNATYLEQRNKDLNKTFRINSIEAASLGESYDELAVSMGTSGETIRNVAIRIEKDLIPGMGKIIAKNGDFGKRLLMTNALLEEHLGVTGEAALNYELYATGMNQSSLGMIGATKQLADQVEAATGLSGQFESMMSEVAGLGADIQMSYKKMPGSLELAVAKAKVLGVTFKQLDATAKGFLNIEESVNNELEYQLLSGKRLVDQNNVSIAQKFREAKLAGNATKMAEAMNDVYETQGDILEGNNYFAKEQLAKTLGMTTDEMMKSYQVQKLYKEGIDKDKIDKLLAMSPGDFAEAAKTMSAAQLDTFNKIKDAESQKTTDQLAKDFYGKALTEGIRVSIGTAPGSQAAAIKESQAAILGADKKGRQGTFVGESAEVASLGMNRSLASLVGASQLMGEAATVSTTQLSRLADNIPVFGGRLKYATERLEEFSNAVFRSTPTAKTTPTKESKDAVLVNDGVIQFHPADKFATVPDGAALLASTGTGQLASAVDSMTGGKTATVDPNPIARAVAAAVQQAMSGLKIEMDGFNLAKAMEFSNRSLNG